jgi:hypothetical protein
MVMQEPVAYFTAALAFYVAARALATPTRGSIGVAIAVGLVAPFVRDELIVVPALMLGALGIRYVCFGGGRAVLARASMGRRVALALAAVVAFAIAVAAARVGSGQVEVAFRSPGTMLDQTLWAWGALIVGVGVLPVVIGLAMLVPAAPIPRSRALAAFVSVFAAAVALFTAYVAVKGAFQAATFEPRVSERNLAYLTPLLFVALALFAATRAIRLWALALAAALTGWAIATVPLGIGQGLLGDAPGLAILSQFNVDYALDPDGGSRLLYGLLAVSVLVGLAPRLLRQRRPGTWIVVGAVLLSIGWTARAEIAASDYSNTFAQLFFKGLPKPLGWIDETTAGQPAVYIGQKIADPNGIWSMEFWNRDVRKVWSLDGTAPGPGPILTPDLIATDGTLAGDPGYRYVVADRSVSVVGDPVATRGDLRVVRITPPPRLTESLAGVFSDGWIGSSKPTTSVSADYNRFDAPRTPGTVFVTVSRKGFCGPKAPGRVLIDVGTLGLGPENKGAIARVTERRGWVVDSCGERTFPIKTPGGPFHVKVTVTPPFQPAALDPNNFEQRYFGAQLRIAFEPPA